MDLNEKMHLKGMINYVEPFDWVCKLLQFLFFFFFHNSTKVEVNKIPRGFVILIRTLDDFWKENRGSVNRRTAGPGSSVLGGNRAGFQNIVQINISVQNDEARIETKLF